MSPVPLRFSGREIQTADSNLSLVSQQKGCHLLTLPRDRGTWGCRQNSRLAGVPTPNAPQTWWPHILRHLFQPACLLPPREDSCPSSLSDAQSLADTSSCRGDSSHARCGRGNPIPLFLPCPNLGLQKSWQKAPPLHTAAAAPPAHLELRGPGLASSPVSRAQTLTRPPVPHCRSRVSWEKQSIVSS